jgi:hypothetical protein
MACRIERDDNKQEVRVLGATLLCRIVHQLCKTHGSRPSHIAQIYSRGYACVCVSAKQEAGQLVATLAATARHLRAAA